MTHRFPQRTRWQALAAAAGALGAGTVLAVLATRIGPVALIGFAFAAAGASVGFGVWLARVELHDLGLTVRNVGRPYFVRWEDAAGFEAVDSVWGRVPAVRTAGGRVIRLTAMAERTPDAEARVAEAIRGLTEYRDRVRSRWSREEG